MTTADVMAKGLYVVVLTLNEAARLPDCLLSASFAEKTIVVDSGSADDTVAVAREHGVEVVAYPDWQGFAVQRNRSLSHCQGARYIFFLDADERITPALRDELLRIVSSGEQAAWDVRWMQVAFGVPLTRLRSHPGMPRLFAIDCLLGFDGVVHEHAQLRPGTRRRTLRRKLVHHSYESVYAGLRKITQYAALGAQKHHDRGERGGVCRGLASAVALFTRSYFFQGGILHGAAGFLFCYFMSQERFYRYVFLRYDRDQLTDRATR